MEALGNTTVNDFTDQLWQDISPIFDSILKHEFVNGLQTGELSLSRFQYYIQQDAIYLAEYARALNQLAARSDNPEAMLQSMKLAQARLPLNVLYTIPILVSMK